MAAVQRSVYLVGLPQDFSEKDLRKALQDIGGIERCVLVNTAVGTFTGNAYVQFDEEKKAKEAAKKNLDGKVQATMVTEDRESEFNLVMAHISTATKVKETTQRNIETVIVQETPKITVFSGTPGRDCSFGRWRYEVECLKRSTTYESQTILHAVRKSLRSPAAELVTHMGSDATLDELLSKLESIYGSVLSGQTLLQRFYSETQKEDETCAEWACRLEDIAFQAQEKMKTTDLKALLVTQFWSGLRDQRIKEALRHQRNSMDFQQFVVQARELEEEFQDSTPIHVRGKAKSQVNKQNDVELLTNLMQKMDKRMNDMEAQMKNLAQGVTCQPSVQPRHQQHHMPFVSQQGNQMQSSGTVTGCHKCRQESHLAFGCRQGTSVICFQCGQAGHISRSCRVQMSSLNTQGPQ